jgi:hypothetical protein
MTNPRQSVVPVQECRFCHCTPEHPCRVPGGDECAFVTEKADRCSAPGCVVAWEAEWDRHCRRERTRMQLVRELTKKSKSQKRQSKRRAA